MVFLLEINHSYFRQTVFIFSPNYTPFTMYVLSRIYTEGEYGV